MGVMIDMGEVGVIVAGTVDSVLDALADDFFHDRGMAEFRFPAELRFLGDADEPVFVHVEAVRMVRPATDQEEADFRRALRG